MTGSGTPELGPALDFLQRLWRLNHSLEQLSARMERRLGLTAQQRLMLRCIGKVRGISAGQLAAVLHVDPGTVSSTLRRLEAKGLVLRARDPADQRRVTLRLSAAGVRLNTPTEGTVEDAVEQILRETPASDAKTAARVLDDLRRALDAR